MESTIQHNDDLTLNIDATAKVVTGFVRDEIRTAGFSKAVVGLSGGIDSSVAAAIAVGALGKENVLGVAIPYKESSNESIADARLMAKFLGIHIEEIPITEIADPLLNEQRVTDRVRRGNILARLRMIVLYDCSSRENALVIGTSNKTEILLGYGTLFGDLACAINPLGDLYKTQVRQLAQFLTVPEKIVAKPPSADLWEGQTDEGDLGFTYEKVDILLHSMIDKRRTDQELRALGFAASFIAQVREMIRKNQFKRRPPLIAKISNRTVNIDFRYPRDWGI